MITDETLLTELCGEYALSVRTLNCLAHYDIMTVGQLKDFTPDPTKDWLVGSSINEIIQVKELINTRSELQKGGHP